MTTGLAITAAAMVAGTVVERWSAPRASASGLAALTLAQAGLVAALGPVRPGAGLSLGVLTVMAFVNGWRSVIAGGLGMACRARRQVAVMSKRASANEVGYLLGAALGGLALAAGGFAGLGTAFSVLFAVGAAVHVAPATGPRRLPAESPT